MAISKIILNGVTQMDLTQDTVANASHIMNEYVGHPNENRYAPFYIPKITIWMKTL